MVYFQESSTETVKESIIKEILEYHKEPEKPKITFDFRPVPKDQIKPKSPNKKNVATFESSKYNDKESNFGLDAFLSKLREQKTELGESSTSKPSSSFAGLLAQHSNNSDKVRKHFDKTASGIQTLSFLSTNSPPSRSGAHDESNEFKVPKGLPISKMKNLSVSPRVGNETSQDDIEMLSAKSAQPSATVTSRNQLEKTGSEREQLSIATGISNHSDVIDVEMLSARNSSREIGQNQAGRGESDVDVLKKGSIDATLDVNDLEKPVNAKAALKAALLKTALRKQQGGMNFIYF